MIDELYLTFIDLFGSDMYSSTLLGQCVDEFCIILTFVCIASFVLIIIWLIKFIFNFIAGIGTRHRF